MQSIVTRMLHQEQVRLDDLKITHTNLTNDLHTRLQTINNLNNDPDSTFKSFTLRTLLSCSSSDQLMKESLNHSITLTETTITMLQDMVQILQARNI